MWQTRVDLQQPVVWSHVGIICPLNKDGGHTIRSVIAENPMIHANLVPLSVIEPELWSIDVLHCGNRDFRLFTPVTLTLSQ